MLALMRKEGRSLLRFSIWIETRVCTPAYTSSGRRTETARPRMFIQPSSPETAMKPSIAETTRKRRLFPVLTAATPRRSVEATYQPPPLVSFI